MIAIINYGMGNSGSIQNMLRKLGKASIITADHGIIERADKLILPGVGAFDAAMQNLESRNLPSLLNDLVIARGKPILGICLGMQLFARGSQEGVLPGLGWIDAETISFRSDARMAERRVPHMGWNTIHVPKKTSVFDDIDDNPRFYFVHSYHVRCNNDNEVLATSEYGITFTAAVIKGNIIGTQFHPEKSHRFGLRLLKNFAEA